MYRASAKQSARGTGHLRIDIRARSSVGKSVCLLTKKANLTKAFAEHRLQVLSPEISRPVIPNLHRRLGDQQFLPFASSIYGIRL